MEELRQAILAGDAGAILLVRRSRAAALPVLQELLNHPEASVRELSLRGMTETGGAPAVEACLKAALDGHPQVRAAAVRALASLLDPPRAGVLLEIFDKCPDPATRRQLALAYGKMEGAPAAPLKERRAKEGDAGVREGLLAAAARKGEEEARSEFLRLLQAAPPGPERVRYLELAEYIGAPWIPKGLVPYLDDLTPAFRTGADGRLERPEYLRVRDVAGGLAISLGRLRTSFPWDPGLPLDDRQTEEIRRLLGPLP